MSWYHGEEWRWDPRHHDYRGVPTYINVIEPKEEPAREGPRVPFGFARVLAPEPVEAEPLLWEGSD